MRKVITKAFIAAFAVSFMCLMFVSCTEIQQPAYFLVSSEEDDLVTVYKAYFELDGSNIRAVLENNYEARILNKKTKYRQIQQTTYVFDALAKSSNPTKWEYEESEEDKELFDQDKLIKYLSQMRTFYTGDIHIIVTVFDDYTALEVWRMENDEIAEIQTGLFRYNSIIELPRDVNLKSLAYIYKLSS